MKKSSDCKSDTVIVLVTYLLTYVNLCEQRSRYLHDGSFCTGPWPSAAPCMYRSTPCDRRRRRHEESLQTHCIITIIDVMLQQSSFMGMRGTVVYPHFL